jgi:hypothetical protein
VQSFRRSRDGAHRASAPSLPTEAGDDGHSVANSRPSVGLAHGQMAPPRACNTADCPRLSTNRGQPWTGSVVPGLQDGSDLFLGLAAPVAICGQVH